MPPRTTWSWKCIKPAADDGRRLTLTLDRATYDRLAALAAEAGRSVAETAASILAAVAEDDAAAHGREG